MKKIFTLLMMLLMAISVNAENILQVKPFKTTANVTEDDELCFEIEMTNDKEFTAMEFHLYLPQGMEIYDEELDADRFNGVTKRGTFTPNATYENKAKDDAGHYYFTLYHSNETEMINGKNGTIIRFYYTVPEGVQPGVYPITIKEMELSHTAFDYVRCAESTSYVSITSDDCPNPSIDGLELRGDVPSFVIDEINESNVSSIDLTNATSIGKALNLANTNAIVYVAEGMDIECNANVVKGNVCTNLTLTDGNSFSTPKSFTATNATYERSISGTWGTIMLPYEVKSNDDVEYYIPTAVENNMLVIEKKETLPANTPALVAKINGSKIQAKAQNVTINAIAGTSANGSVTMYGSYENNKKVTDADAYYIKNNAFVRCNGYFFIDAFRAYFTVSGASAKTIGIPGFEATAIEALLNDDKSDAVNYYDESGRQMNGLKSGINIMRLSNGQVIKVKR